MSSPRSILILGLVAAIAVGCGTTTASGGNGASGGADTSADSAVNDASGTDAISDGTDATDPTDLQCQDSTGCFEEDGKDGDTQNSDAGTDSTVGTDAVSDDASAGTCPPVLKDKTLGLHAKACTQDADCAYGLCQIGGFLTGYDNSIGYCTKDCACSDPAAQCSSDNASGKEFICGFELSKSGGNPKAGATPQKRCSLHCLTDADCAAWNPAMPHCIGSTNYVSSAGVCGFDPLK